MTKNDIPPAKKPAQARFTSDAEVGALAQRALARLCHQAAHNDCAAGAVLGSPIPAALAYALCDDSSQSADMIVDDLMNAGLSVQDICLEHLAPAARRLGDLWDRDRLPFTEVTIATARIQSILRRLPSDVGVRSMRMDLGAVFAAAPGEQHTLGVIMATDMFRRAGWDIGLLVGLSHQELLQRLARDDRSVIGLSCGGDHSFEALKQLMTALRRQRPDALVLVSGQIVQQPERLAALPQPFTTVADGIEVDALIAQLSGGQPSRTPQQHAMSAG